MFTTVSFNHHRDGARQKKPAVLFLTLVLMSALGFLAYSIVPRVRVRADGVEMTSGRTNSLTRFAVQPGAAPATPAAELIDAIFQVSGLANKCIAFGKLRTRPGDTPFENNDPVFLYDCNGTPNQQVRVVELARHGITPQADKPNGATSKTPTPNSTSYCWVISTATAAAMS